MTPGALIGGKYRLTRQIGAGSMGVVWAATNELISREVALKLILSSNDELRRRLRREAQACGQLRQRNIVEVYDVGETAEGDPFLVMQLLYGETLAELLKRVFRLDPPQAARIARDVALALIEAHGAKVIHRDLKPANIFLHEELDQDGARIKTVKVLDFGVSKNLTGDTPDGLATVAGGLIGSPAYMSPEQAKAQGNLDHRSDLWSLGVMLFEMLCGKRPFQGDTDQLLPQIAFAPIPPVSRFVRLIDPGLVSLVSRCLERDLSQRVQSAAELAELLKPFCEGGASAPKPSASSASPSHVEAPAVASAPAPSPPAGEPAARPISLHDSGRIASSPSPDAGQSPPQLRQLDAPQPDLPKRSEAEEEEWDAETKRFERNMLPRPFPTKVPALFQTAPLQATQTPTPQVEATAPFAQSVYGKTAPLGAPQEGVVSFGRPSQVTERWSALPQPAPWAPPAPSDGAPLAPSADPKPDFKTTMKMGPDQRGSFPSPFSSSPNLPAAIPPSGESGSWHLAPAAAAPASTEAPPGTISSTAPLLAPRPTPPAAVDASASEASASRRRKGLLILGVAGASAALLFGVIVLSQLAGGGASSAPSSSAAAAATIESPEPSPASTASAAAIPSDAPTNPTPSASASSAAAAPSLTATSAQPSASPRLAAAPAKQPAAATPTKPKLPSRGKIGTIVK
jgi:serine/threonine-protein kinase